ncbi:GTP pyrophosphokinase [Photobacterium phosphoreum]|uniref:GTP pyrophosphokinase n=1 Tax=Photobacterium phosphoreum TaxID=659 RepID=UPI0024B8ACB5|nr:hypothetical protein [Photobacterium phosphoreum]
MNETDFLTKWQKEKQAYQKWGDYVVSKITDAISSSGYDFDSFVKLPPKARIKGDNSLIDKAFYRPNKNYTDPYNEIEDKVGCRFVLLLVEHVNAIAEMIRAEGSWSSLECRHFSEERTKDPLLFTYQSVHYIVRAKASIKYQGITIPEGMPCEIQIRTLLQHAYAELTHDSIYKAKKIVQPEVHRTVAKSMALIETTDDFFSDVNNKLAGPIETLDIISMLDSLYKEFIGQPPLKIQKSSIVILDTFEDLFNNKTQSQIRNLLMDDEYCLIDLIKDKSSSPFFKQSISIFTCWLILERRTRLSNDWPLDSSIIQNLASSLSVSMDMY